MKTCTICNINFENAKTYSNHVRWKHKQATYHNVLQCEFCDKRYPSHIKHSNTCPKHPNNLRECKQCNQIFSAVGYNKNAMFCGHSCSATFNNITRRVNTRKTKNSNCVSCGKIVIVKNHIATTKCSKCKSEQKLTYAHICVICNISFTSSRNIHKTCSKKCKGTLLSINSTNNPNCGGETNYNRYVRNNITFDSSWEVEIAEFLDNNNIKWIRDRKIVLYWIDSNNKKRRYYPDFYLPEFNVYVDPKNQYKQSMDKEKIQYIKSHNTLIVGEVLHCKVAIMKLLSKDGDGAN